MTPLQTARVLLSVCLLAAIGCAPLPWRGEETVAKFEPPMNVGPSALPVPQGAGSTIQQQLPSALPTGAVATSQAVQMPTRSGSATGRPPFPTPAPGLAPSQNATGTGPSMTELTGFMEELENATHIDPTARSEILTTVLQTPHLIPQYRAMLAFGQAPAAASAPPRSAVVPAPALSRPPQEPAFEPAAEAVVSAAHRQPIEPPESKIPLKRDSSPDLEDELIALLRKVKGTKVEAAAYNASGDLPEDGDSYSRRETAGKRAPGGATWEELVDSAIEKLERERDRRVASSVREEDEARLRMLYLIADRRDDAVRAIASLEPEMQEFWSKQLFGLATLMSPELIADRSNRMIESKRNLDEALRRLGESSPLFVRNLAFVTDVQSYGSYTPFDEYEFRPGEPVLLYAEVENYRCKETARGYHTALRSSYEIFDSRRQRVAEHESSTTEEYCRNARRDFFTIYEFTMPEKLYPGKYELRLTVADLNGDKAGESSITFHIRDEM
jgi:hypothetical protein